VQGGATTGRTVGDQPHVEDRESEFLIERVQDRLGQNPPVWRKWFQVPRTGTPRSVERLNGLNAPIQLDQALQLVRVPLHTGPGSATVPDLDAQF